MKKIINGLAVKASSMSGKMLASFVLLSGLMMVDSASVWYINQPKEPKEVGKLSINDIKSIWE